MLLRKAKGIASRVSFAGGRIEQIKQLKGPHQSMNQTCNNSRNERATALTVAIGTKVGHSTLTL